MAFMVRRPGNRWEIRESFTSEAGPRARTLVSFKMLTPEVIERALLKARGPVDRDGLVRAARRAGAPIEPSAGDALAESLIRSLARGAGVRPGLRGVLLAHLRDDNSARVDDSFTMWIGAPPEERAAALVDLLELADRLPKPPKRPLRFPRLASRAEG